MDVSIAGLFEDAEEDIMFLMTLLLKSKADAFNKRKG
jgi:hypothetical protein